MVKNDGNVEIQGSSTLQPGHGNNGSSSNGVDSTARLEDEAEPPDTGISTPSIINDTATFPTSGIARSSRSSSQSSKCHLAKIKGDHQVTIAVIDHNGHHHHNVTPSVETVTNKAYALTIEQCLAVLKTDASTGLDEIEAKQRLDADGPNTVKEAKAVSVWTILLRQVANALTIILLAAMALSFGVRDWIEGGVVCAVIVVNVTIGFVQEYKAEHALASLKSLSSPSAVLIRSSQTKEVVAKDIVVGDIVLFKVGDLLPADLRIISSTNLEIEEAPLTGESVPVIKTLDAITSATDNESLSPGDCTNLAFAGTTVTKGRGRGLVIATGMNTQMGHIARQLDRRGANKQANAALPFHRRVWEPIARFLGLRDGTPLQRKLARFALILLGLAILCAIIVFSVAEFHLTDDVVLYAIALGIGVLPESLIAVLTITFSVGAKRMAQSNVIVRKLDALEALGGISDIFSDKTGTLTHGKMVVNKAWIAETGETWTVAQGGASVLEPVGDVKRENRSDNDTKKMQHSDNLLQLAVAASLCNLAEVYKDELDNWQSRGDPTEVALQVFALKLGMDRSRILDSDYNLEQEHPFDSMLKRMTMMYVARETSERTLFMKGAPERVLDCCSRMHSSTGNAIKLGEAARIAIMNEMEILASQGLRVLAFAKRRLILEDDDTLSLKKGDGDLVQTNKQLTRAEAEQDFEFIGLCGLHDPPRAETLDSVRTCQGGHIVVHMLTGDHISTARAIARQVGILDGSEPPSAVMSASQFDNLTDEEVDQLPMLPLVIARCSPTTKVRMVAAGERRKRYLLMCGDGINDAPALLHAPIGIAMGSGTDVAKDSAQLILQDDKFDNIAKAVKEGRTVFKNIQRFMIALLVLNVAEVLLLLVGLAIRDVEGESIFPISPIGILVLNLIAGLPAIGLGFEAAEEDVMTKPPHDLKAGVLSRQVLFDLFVYGFTMGWTCLVVFIAMIYGIGDGLIGLDCNAIGPDCGGIFQARSATFATLFLQGLIITWQLISIEDSIFRCKTIHRLRDNPFLFWSVIFGLGCIPACIYIPFWSTDVFRQSSLGGAGWGIAIAANFVFCLTVELWKYFARRGAWPWLTRVTGGSPSKKRTSEKASIV